MSYQKFETVYLSPLGKTWIFDLDGTLVKHNGYKMDGKDSLLPGVAQFFKQISDNDFVLIITARAAEWKDNTVAFLIENGIRFNHIIFDAPHGERILINDRKNSGLSTAYAINTKRDEFLTTAFIIDDKL
ncbi:hypothetical protein EHV15_04470 [Paenibacillus oralis]|uniref:FCP1 homology domain-containing protein n=1 Tax=Paenibacillus oralis TaxID=2490856 RepID=A0A3P3TWY0_9BACL|nr:NIF family HAD-type phosphatase [Paenibacillus oralis]RRJ62284.1 hypothetical protein EHV15_04470 [Paenibacillus oralis]